MNFLQELNILIKSRYPLIYIPTYEEERMETTLNQIAKLKNNWTINSWDFINGYYSNPNDKGTAVRHPLEALEVAESVYTKNKNIFLLKDFDQFLNDVSIIRKLKNLAYQFKLQSNHIITASTVNIPNNIKPLFTILHFPLPNKQEIKQELGQLLQHTNKKVNPIILNDLIESCQGLPLETIRKIFIRILAESSNIEQGYKNGMLILTEKRQIINKTQILEFYDKTKALSGIGGLDRLKKWLSIRQNSFSEQAKLYGLPNPKGLLLVGVQGTGKSLTAKAIAHEWKLPLLRLLFTGIVGESEARIREAINICESMAPCIVWVDEIDKAFTGIYSQGDSGTTSRVFGTFTTWLSEKESGVFVVATANQINNLPAELTRKGRFDEIFFVGLPTYDERKEIIKVILKRLRPNTWNKYNLKNLAQVTEKLSGAEIEQLIIESMHIAYKDNRD
uniref:hypothetical protein n=1 Tax=Erythrolobus coxiae TaxID=362235 RepID=UPI001FCDB834|nr:hypothetical protein MW556_pgp005 [Erythrolobus coxiae]UNJ17802.1 hypothetical protein [Erythrolobus coxiae]